MTNTEAELASELASAVTEAYPVAPPVACRFLRHGFNDHFRVTTGDGERHVRLYLDGKYYISGDDDLRFELALADTLAAAGCPVARPVPRRDGELLTIATIGGRPRRVAVFEMAPGAVPTAPDHHLAGLLGAAIAHLHEAADRCQLPGSRYHLDATYLLDQPVRELSRLAGDRPEVAAITELAEQLRVVLGHIPRAPGDYGIIHADLHPGNIHVDDDGTLTIFDFDHCAYGWRAYDLAPVRMVLGDEHWTRLLDGYRSVRPLPNGIDHMDEFVKMRRLWDVGDILAMQVAWNRTEPGEKIADGLPDLARSLGVAAGS